MPWNDMHISSGNALHVWFQLLAMQPVHPRQARTLAANEHSKHARAGLDETPLAGVNMHMHKVSFVLESLVFDLLNQRAHMHAKARGTPSAGVDKRFHVCVTVDVWCSHLALKSSPLVSTASTECAFPIQNSAAAS